MRARELAEEEDRVWRRHAELGDKLPSEQPCTYIARHTGASGYAVEQRRTLFLMGAAAEPLWERVEGGMSAGTAVRIVREHAPRGDRPRLGDLTVGEVVDAINAYDRAHRKGAHEVVSADGTRCLRRNPKRKQPEWRELRALVAEHAKRELGEVGGQDAARIVAEFEVELQSVLSDFRSKVSRARRLYAGATFAGPSRASVERASAELGVPAPERGMMADMKLARERKRVLAKKYHPDVTGNEDSRPMLDAALAAFRVLEDYNDQVGGRDAERRTEGAGDVG